MAAPMKEADSNRENVGDDTLNLSSPSLDPLKALYSSRVVLPCPNTVPLNNIAEYVSFTEGKSRRQRQAQKQPTEKLHATHKGTGVPKEKNEKGDSERKLPRNRRNVLTRMEEYKRGPLNFLQRCVQERLLVQVWIRSAVDLRGMCKGYIVAFDKHFNLAMIDVDELYRCPLWKEAQLRKDSKREKRRLKQLKEQMAQLSMTAQTTTTRESYSEKKDSKESEIKVVSLPQVPNQVISSKTERNSTSELQSVEKVQMSGKNQTDSSSVSECETQNQNAEAPQASEQTPHLPETVSTEDDPTSLNKEEPSPSKSLPQFLERHVNQLFVRGDNVVSIMMLE